MAFKGFYIETEAISGAIRKLKAYSKKLEKTVEAEIADTAVAIERKAAQRVPKDLGGGGGLASAIVAEKERSLQWQVVAQKKYAAYVEFGTGDLVDVPAGLEDYALQFKASPEIRRVNLPARPYLFPTYFEETEKLKKRLAELLKETIK
jgi:HK97 gp10 family phage protein